jgi:hypothetical protein
MSHKTILSINTPGLYEMHKKQINLLVIANKYFSKLESQLIRDLYEDDFMGTYGRDLTNLEEIKIVIEDTPQNVLQRAEQYSVETGIVFDEVGQFCLNKKGGQTDLAMLIKNIIGDMPHRVLWDKYEVLKKSPVLA